MARLRALADLVHNVTSYGPTAIGRALDPDPEMFMENTRELTVDDLERMHPSLFRDN